MIWTHQKYYQRFQLNVEQYGEILIAHIFEGRKMGDAQPCFDNETTNHKVRANLLTAGASAEAVDACLSGSEADAVRIEVKSKLTYTQTGRANVIHCNENKINGVRSFFYLPLISQ